MIYALILPAPNLDSADLAISWIRVSTPWASFLVHAAARLVPLVGRRRAYAVRSAPTMSTKSPTEPDVTYRCGGFL